MRSLALAFWLAFCSSSSNCMQIATDYIEVARVTQPN